MFQHMQHGLYSIVLENVTMASGLGYDKIYQPDLLSL